MFIPCPQCGVPLSSEGPDRFCIYCDRFFNEMPVLKNGKFVSQSFFYDNRRPPRCNIALDVRRETLAVFKNKEPLMCDIDYEVGFQNNVIYLTFLKVPDDGDYITVTSEVI